MFDTSQFPVLSPCRGDVATWRYIIIGKFRCHDNAILMLRHLVGVATLMSQKLIYFLSISLTCCSNVIVDFYAEIWKPYQIYVLQVFTAELENTTKI